ncbi:MAG: hypothetical protein R6V62_05490 [Candidatus Fermentibacteraceae bacterium]
METARSGMVFVDVQAAGVPGNGVLLEVAWAAGEGSVHCFTVRPPAGACVPAIVRSLTGITPDDSAQGIPLAEAAHLLRAALYAGFTVAHHAQYELKWLRWLTGLPLAEYICTRELARKRLPGLRAFGLRAVAGYLGWPLPELRRAREHVEATRFVWLQMPRIPESTGSRVSREERLSAPDAPGVYEMLDSRGAVLYVGKSRSIRKRLASWFTGGHGGGAGELSARAHRVRWTVCTCPFTASMLEARRILELDPPCNRAGRPSRLRCMYLGADWRLYADPPERGVFRGPFPSEASLKGLLLAHRLLVGEDADTALLPALREQCEDGNLFRLGLRCFRREEPEEPTDLDRLLEGVAYGALLARRGALLRFLRGCTVHWSGGELPDSLAWPDSEGELKLLGAFLAGLRELDAEGMSPRVEVPGKRNLSTDQIHELLRFV